MMIQKKLFVGIVFMFMFALLLTSNANADEVSISLDYEISDFTQEYNFTLNTADTQMGIFVTEDGKRFYHADRTRNAIYQYDLSTPYDLSTYTLNTSKSISLTYAPIWLSSDEKIFVNARANNVLDIYNNSGLDVSTMTLIGTYVIPYAYFGVAFSPDGLKLFVTEHSTNKLAQYGLTHSYNLTTATLEHTFSTTTSSLSYRCSTFQGIQVLNSGKGFLIGCTSSTPAIEGYVLFNATTPYNISTITNNVGVNFGLGQAGRVYFANNKNFYIAEDGSPRKIIHYTTNYENYPPNAATDIKPSNTTITLNSTGVTIPINWSGGDDNNSDVVTAQVYLKLFSDYEFITNTTTQSESMTLNNSYLTSAYYQIYLNLTDGVNHTISTGDFFKLCVNDWSPSNTTCEGNLQTLIYTDTNNCPLSYDVPTNNGSVSACNVGGDGGTGVIINHQTIYDFISFQSLLTLFVAIVCIIIGFVLGIYSLSILGGLFFIMGGVLMLNDTAFGFGHITIFVLGIFIFIFAIFQFFNNRSV